MTPHARQSLVVFLAMCAFVSVSWLIFRSYLTPEMAVYFLSFTWCF
jgi:hypothetical protein